MLNRSVCVFCKSLFVMSFLFFPGTTLSNAGAREKPEPGRVDAEYDKLLDEYVRPGLHYKQRFKIIARFMSQPKKATRYLNSMFNPKTDPLFKPDVELPEDIRKKVIKHRRAIVRLLGTMAVFDGRILQETIDLLPEDQRAEAADFVDEICKTHRLEFFRRALKNNNGKVGNVPGELEGTRDLRLMDDLIPLADGGINRWDRRIRLFRCAAGQQARMRKYIDAEIWPTPAAFEYAWKAGDGEFAIITTIAAVRDYEQNKNKANIGCNFLRNCNSPKARQEVLRLLKDPKTPYWLRNGLERMMPGFFAEERVPFYFAYYGDPKKWKKNEPQKLINWLSRQNNNSGMQLARQMLKRKERNMSHYWALEYLVKFGDKKVLEQTVKQANSDDPKTFPQPTCRLIRAGLVEKLPKNIEGKIVAAPDWFAGSLLFAIEKRPHKDLLPILKKISEDPELKYRCLVVQVKLGDAQAVAFLKEMLPTRWALQRVFGASVLYRAGHVDQFDDLVDILKCPGFYYRTRVQAIEALGFSPKQLKLKAAKVLLNCLTDPCGDVSQASHDALVQLSGRKDIEFSPWATDDIRNKQAAQWRKWVQSLK